MSLPAGNRIGPLPDPRAPIGAGGMGEVYRARDTTLDRDVAIKVLPESFAADPDRLARFTRSAGARGAESSQHRADLRPRGVADYARSRWSWWRVPTLADRQLARPDAAGRSAAHRPADRRGARSRARARHRPSRSQARQYQAACRRHRQGARLRSGQSDGSGSGDPHQARR